MSAIVVRKVATEEEACSLVCCNTVDVAVVGSSEGSQHTRFKVSM